MEEEIKDPNQLDMFAGVLLTADQQEQVNKYIANRKQTSIVQQQRHTSTIALLRSNGFIEGVHFEQSCKVTTETRPVTLGYNYNNTAFDVDIEFEQCDSQIYLKGQNFYEWEVEKKIKPAKFWFEIEGQKIRCSSITDQYRFIKPKTMLEKLKQHNERVVERFKEYQKKSNLEQNIIEKYSKLYPNAEVTSRDIYSKSSGSFKIVEVLFKSGSYVQFRLDIYNNIEYVYAKHDAVAYQTPIEELLEKFNNQ